MSADIFTYYSTGYSNLIALSRSIKIQSAIEATNRSGFNAFLLDFTDFAYGVSPVMFAAFLLIGSSLAVGLLGKIGILRKGVGKSVHLLRDVDSLIGLTLASIVVVAISGVLDIETARVWLMLMVPMIICVALWVASNHDIRAYRSFLFCQAVWGATLLLRYQFLF